MMAPQTTCLQNYRKPTGYVSVPVYTNHNKNTATRVQRTVNTIFDEGKPATVGYNTSQAILEGIQDD